MFRLVSPRRFVPSRSGLAVTSAAAVVAGTLGWGVVPTAASAAETPFAGGPCTTQTYVVPAGVSQVSIRAVGQAGEAGDDAVAEGVKLHGGGAGGRGAAVTNLVDVTPGQTLYAGVASPALSGGAGGGLYYSQGLLDNVGARGGNGTFVTTAKPSETDCSYDPASMLVVAAGGGGGGNAGFGSPGGTGGAAGSSGNAGGSNEAATGAGGSAGSLRTAGAGGTAGYVYDAPFVCPLDSCRHRSTGQGATGRKAGLGVGADRTGSIGGTGGDSDSEPDYAGQPAGGGGGGVFGGGGGGGGGFGFNGVDGGAGGGGGGGSYPESTATPTTDPPSVTFTPTYGTTTTVTSSVSPSEPGQAVTFTATVAAAAGRKILGGNITFVDSGDPDDPGRQSVIIAEDRATLVGDGATSSMTTSALSPGTHVITATYSGFNIGEPGKEPDARSRATLTQVVVSDQTVAFTSSPGSRVAYGDPYVPTATSSARLPVTFAVDASSNGVCSIDPDHYPRVIFTGEGTCTINADAAASETVRAGAAQQSFAVAFGEAPKAQVITFTSTPPADLRPGDTYEVSATGGDSGQPVEFSASSIVSACRMSGPTTVTIDIGGPCTIRATQAGIPGYDAGQADQSFLIEPLDQVVTFETTPPEQPAVGDSFTLTSRAPGGPVTTSLDPSSVACSLSGHRYFPDAQGNTVTTDQVTLTGTGPCVINGYNIADNYAYNTSPVKQYRFVVGIPQPLAFTSDAPSGVQAADTYAPTTSAGNAPGQEPVTITSDTPATCSVTDGIVTFTAVGLCTITAGQAGTTTYAAADPVSQDIVVGRSSQTVTFSTAAPTDAEVDGTYTPQTTGGGSAEPVVISSTTSDTCEVTDGVVTFIRKGTCTVAADQAGTDDYLDAGTTLQDIEVAGLAQTVAITSRAPRGAVPGDTYTPTTTGGDSGEPVLIDTSTPAVCTASDGVVTFLAAGTCSVVASQDGTSRYAAAAEARQAVTVAVVTADPAPVATGPSGSSPTTTGSLPDTGAPDPALLGWAFALVIAGAGSLLLGRPQRGQHRAR